MTDPVQDALQRLLRDYGQEVLGDPFRVEALLRDFLPDRRREVHLLITAVTSGFIMTLTRIGADHAGGVDVVVWQAIRSLQEDFGLSRDAAEWSVGNWSQALGLALREIPGGVAPPTTDPRPTEEPRDALTDFATPTSRRRALRLLAEITARDPSNAVALALRAEALLLEGHDGAAIESAEAALRLDHSSVIALRVRGEVYARRGVLSAALIDLTRSLAIDANQPEALLSRSAVYRVLAQLPEALADLDRAVELKPSAGTYYARSAVLAQLGRHLDAALDMRRSLAMSDEEARSRRLSGGLDQLREGSGEVMRKARTRASQARTWLRGAAEGLRKNTD